MSSASTSIAQSLPIPTQQGVLTRLQEVYTALHQMVADSGDPRLVAAWPEWESRLKGIAAENQRRPEVAIALVGGTGAGKSTLLNAILDARLLPVSQMRACTAAISEVAYAADGKFSATIEFVPRAAWQAEMTTLLADLADADDRTAADEREGDAPSGISHAALDKLRAVYGDPEDRDWRPPRDHAALVEPPMIRAALDAGVGKIESGTIEEFRKEIAAYLDSKGRLWPIVRTMRIRGPFAALRGGAKLVDLPGVNDPNEAREEVTKRYLKECRYVWIVFNIKRVLTRDTLSLMQSDDFLRSILLDGRENALTFIGTASDDIDAESGREEFGLEEDASEGDVIFARNGAVRGEVGRQLDDLAGRLATLAGDPQRAVTLGATFRNSTILTVSAREYLRLAGLAKTRAAGLEAIVETEIPAIRTHMGRICDGHDVAAQAATHHRAIDVLLDEARHAVALREQALRAAAEQTERQRKEAEAAVMTAHGFLEHDLRGATERFVETLAADQKLLNERLSRGIERARHDLDRTTAGWSGLHWATLRAITRRGGVYVGSNGRHDLAADLAKPILDAIAFAWSDFFGERLGLTLDEGARRLLRISDEHQQRLAVALTTGEDAPPLPGLADTTARIVREQVGQTKEGMAGRIEGVRRTLYEQIPGQVRANLAPACARVAQERGSGMKARMVAGLTEHARQTAGTMFADAEEAIRQGVRALTDGLGQTYGEMAGTIDRHARVGLDNLRAGAGDRSAAAIERERATLAQMHAQLADLHRGDVIGSQQRSA